MNLATATADDIVTEERSGDEVLVFEGHQVAPDSACGSNPAFDVTPHDVIGTGRGIVETAQRPFPRLLHILAG